MAGDVLISPFVLERIRIHMTNLSPIENGWKEVDEKYEFTWFEEVQLPPFVSDILRESNEEENKDHERTQSKEIEEESDDDTDNTELTDDENEISSEIESLITDYPDE
ncbi:uncharacterized protein [Temnothorax longispinosus]|uniref:uncharacterized protein n=1 Tax=Temnothorax longispinosus TaxID=300112 RepID=UPI003A98D6D2